MSNYFLRFIFLLAFCLLSKLISAQEENNEAHIQLALRKIGHELLLNSGDDSSRVLPIEKIENRYKIQFENDFSLLPIDLANIIQPIVQLENIAETYRVEVETCDTNIVMYGYEIGVVDSTDVIACSRRFQPKDCYIIYFTILDSTLSRNLLPIADSLMSSENKGSTFAFIILLCIFLSLTISLLLYFRFKKVNHEHVINLGKYQFDQRKMLLILKSSTIELTSKESDLLTLLHQSANQTLEREVILNSVWGDEGDYVGRTLDVFISKLRKKLVADQSIKIVNVRGVGYKMILDI